MQHNDYLKGTGVKELSEDKKGYIKEAVYNW